MKNKDFRKKVQLTDTLIMVSPDHFGFNSQTALTNSFQTKPNISEKDIQKTAMKEFTDMVTALRSKDINVLVLPSRKNFLTPDAVFPNNWFSHHQTGEIILYPMLTPNRQAERQPDKLLKLLDQVKVNNPKILDLTSQEKEGKILEGTGSMVLDRVKRVAFAMESPRTTKEAFLNWCLIMNYEPVFFHAYDTTNLPIYHTNVVMSIGKEFAVYCSASIKISKEKDLLEKKFNDLGKEIVDINLSQLYSFCGNILQVKSKKGDPKIVLSQSAMKAFTKSQKAKLQKYGELIPVNISTIEKIGGGSARCMIAEVFPAY